MRDSEFVAMYSKNLKFYRLAFNLTQEDLAIMVEVEPYNISLWENGKRLPSPYHRVKLSDIFSVNLLVPFNS